MFLTVISHVLLANSAMTLPVALTEQASLPDFTAYCRRLLPVTVPPPTVNWDDCW